MADQKDTYGANSKFTGILKWPEELTIVGIDCKDEECPDLRDPRINAPIDPDKLESIRRHGVFEPVHIKKFKGDPRVYITDGRQRVRMAREANKTLKGEFRIQVKCVYGDAADPLTAMILGNSGRLDLTPLGQAELAQRLRARGASDTEIAATMCVSASTVSGWKTLKGAPAEALVAVADGTMSAQAAKEIARLPPSKHAEAVAAVKAAKGKGAAAVKAVKAVKEGKATEHNGKMTVPQLRSLLEDIAPTDDEPYEKGDSNIELVWTFLGVILGESTPTSLKDYPDVQKAVRKAMKP